MHINFNVVCTMYMQRAQIMLCCDDSGIKSFITIFIAVNFALERRWCRAVFTRLKFASQRVPWHQQGISHHQYGVYVTLPQACIATIHFAASLLCRAFTLPPGRVAARRLLCCREKAITLPQAYIAASLNCRQFTLPQSFSRS